MLVIICLQLFLNNYYYNYYKIKIFETLKIKYPNHTWRILYGTSYLKDAGKCLEEISACSDDIYLI